MSQYRLPRSSQRGFSLLEIFVVVIIVMIMVAIILPKMRHDGGSRAKVSRVKSDQRSLASAIEAYYVDNNEYPAMANGALGVNAKFGGKAGANKMCTFRRRNAPVNAPGLNTLTTPISYITSLLSDPFASTRGAIFGYRQFAYTWVLISYGPDRDENDKIPSDHYNTLCTNNLRKLTWQDGDGSSGSVTYDLNFEKQFVITISQPSADYLAAVGVKSGSALIYDPTNGTTSEGDVVRIKQ